MHIKELNSNILFIKNISINKIKQFKNIKFPISQHNNPTDLESFLHVIKGQNINNK